MIEAISSEDLIKIVKVCFPDLKHVASRLIGMNFCKLRFLHLVRCNKVKMIRDNNCRF